MKIEANADDLAQARAVIEQQLKSLGSAGTSATVTSVSKAQALEQLKAQIARAGGNSGALAALQENPLPEAFVIQLPHLAPVAANTLAEALKRSIAKVDLVQVDTDWMQTLGRFIRVLNLVLWLTAGVFCVVVMAVTFNATRSQALQLRDEIEVARLVGATDSFIRRPFFYRGALLGLLGGAGALLLGLALLAGVAYAFQPVSSALSSLLRDYAVAGARWGESAIVIFISAVLGALGGGWAAQRQLGVFKESE
jgi:cell division transport system permease protein